MRAGFIPTRPERKERNMAVPASKRAQAMGEYVRQARIVLSETQHLMRRWPKSRERVEIRDGVVLAFDVFAGVEFADVHHCPSLISDSSIS